MEATKDRAAFVMPVKLAGSERELRFLHEAVDSIKNQTDENWILVMIDDFSDDDKVYAALDEIKKDLKDKVDITKLEKNVGAGQARNVGVARAAELGAPFILFNDSDDNANPRRLEFCRKAFEDESVNVVYMSFDIIDENSEVRSPEGINMSVQEIIDGHKYQIVEGEDAWIQIATRKKYTTQTSSTAVRTSIAVKTPFPKRSVSEDSHTFVRYGAYPGKFVFVPEIKNAYRICRDQESRSRTVNADFYEQMAAVDKEGFEEAMKLAKSYGRVKPEDEDDIRRAFWVRLALSEYHGGADAIGEDLLRDAVGLSREKTLEDIDKLYCGDAYKEKMRAAVARM